MSTGAKVGIGCAVTILLVIVLVCGGAITWYFVSWGEYEQFADEFEQRGYTRMSGSGITIERDVSGPLVVIGWGVNVESDVDGALAIAAYGANIEGTVNGDLDFYGFGLNIGPNAHITGDIRIRSAAGVSIEGRVDGEVTGEWRALEDRRRPAREQPEEQPETPSDDQASQQP